MRADLERAWAELHVLAREACHVLRNHPLEQPLAAALAVIDADQVAAGEVLMDHPPLDELAPLVPLVMYFATQRAAEDFVATVREAKPGMASYQLQEGKNR